MKKQLLFPLRILIIISALVGLSTLVYPQNELYKFTYYTNLSNLLVLIFYVYVLIFRKNKEESNNFLRVKAGVTMSIVLTFAVYSALLAKTDLEEGSFNTIKNYTLHYIVPILTFIDWLIYDKKGVYKKIDPILWTFLPILYTIFSIVKGYVFRIPIPGSKHSPYPYFFCNIDGAPDENGNPLAIGWSGFFTYFFVILLAYVLLGYVLLLIKRKPKNKN